MLFDNHIKLQTSQTLPFEVLTQPQFDNHKKSHTSQTVVVDDPKLSLFYNHIKLHTSQTIIDEISMCRSLTTIKNYTPLKPKYNM